jgi:DNA-binding beta-propeller fold protein YncE
VSAEEEFVEFASAASPRLRRMAFLLSGDWHTAEDLVQTTLGKVFVSWRKIRRREAEHAYANRTLVFRYPAGGVARGGRLRWQRSYGHGDPDLDGDEHRGKAIKVATGPVAVAFTPDGKTAYVVSLGADMVTPISTATNTPGTPSRSGYTPTPSRSPSTRCVGADR